MWKKVKKLGELHSFAVCRAVKISIPKVSRYFWQLKKSNKIYFFSIKLIGTTAIKSPHFIVENVHCFRDRVVPYLARVMSSSRVCSCVVIEFGNRSTEQKS